MTRRILNKKSDVTYLEFLDEVDDRVSTQWNSDSSNEGLFLDSKSEILWSRDKFFSEKDFFHGFSDDSSGLTERTTSSCSWHNDDFDMNSSSKVKASLEGIEDALYEQKQSPLINQSVFQECSEWSKRFPYFRLKGEQVIRPVDDSVALYSSSQQDAVTNIEDVPGSLQVEGKKMVIHVLERYFKKPVINSNVELNDGPGCLEEIFEFDGEYEECLALDNKEAFEKAATDLEEDSAKAESCKIIEEKIIENIAQDIWPMVLSVLQNIEKTTHDVTENFQLPPIVSTIQQQKLAQQRPRTEGTDMLAMDFPSLSTILTISPKLLQSKEDGHWKQDFRSARPTSEIHFSRRSYATTNLRRRHEPLKVSPCLSQLNSFIQVQSLSRKAPPKDDKASESVSQLLPAVEEDIPESGEAFIEFTSRMPSKSTLPQCDFANFSRRGESFLPPIERRSPVSANVKLTRNLFTFFEPDLKSSQLKEDPHELSRPNTSVSRKSLKYSGNLNQKVAGRLSNNSFSSKETRKLNDLNEDKQVTLFPIVTPLSTNKDRHSARKGPVTSMNNKRKR